MLLVGLLIGALIGGAVAYVVWHNNPSSTATTGTPTAKVSATATPTATPATTATPTSTATSAPSASASSSGPAAGHLGLDGCPQPAAGQHPLGDIGPVNGGRHADPSLDWIGCGSVTVPAGTTRFTTADNWDLADAMTCPNELDYGPQGMGPSIVVTELLPDGSTGPDSVTGQGPWEEQGGSLMPHGGNFQLKITAPDPRCRWHFAAYLP